MDRLKANLVVALVTAVMCLPPTREGQQPAAQKAKSSNSSRVTVDASALWVDTNIDLNAGERVQFTASGEITYLDQGKTPERTFGPDGLPRSFRDVIHQYPVGDAGHGALVGRLGPADSGQPFLVGRGKST